MFSAFRRRCTASHKRVTIGSNRFSASKSGTTLNTDFLRSWTRGASAQLVPEPFRRPGWSAVAEQKGPQLGELATGRPRPPSSKVRAMAQM